jgi:hypothetical protein
MTVRTCVAISCLLLPALGRAQQANINLDYNPQKNTDNFNPYHVSPLTAHVWQSWRRSLHLFAQSLFKD